MKLTSISDRFFQTFRPLDPEILEKDDNRPYLIILRLKYKGKRHDFAIPFRSNIASYIPKEQYFPLPPRPTTRTSRIHGLHYVKMFPIKKPFLEKFHTMGDPYYITISDIIKRNLKEIIGQAQAYLDRYQAGQSMSMSTNIELIYNVLNPVAAVREAAAGSQEMQTNIHAEAVRVQMEKPQS
ncbi:hypothetical protein KP806_22770 [Paenibacillus sp. N4]|uniref:hypothetical protein n=1 Tax=Paenibacillus vietnamensis TaxID=2590547 RepID=UPI001CD13505|nr:hypothetical protein [Paenibacillus vietnamensis]MCA0757888.1 hypothetical protein [Paenibacillus vietnamensis]